LKDFSGQNCMGVVEKFLRFGDSLFWIYCSS
jgi:hypothetical protein